MVNEIPRLRVTLHSRVAGSERRLPSTRCCPNRNVSDEADPGGTKTVMFTMYHGMGVHAGHSTWLELLVVFSCPIHYDRFR